MAAERRSLRVAREKRGLTLESLAERLEVARTTVWNWESGRHTPGPRMRLRLASALGIPLDHLAELLEGDRDSAGQPAGAVATGHVTAPVAGQVVSAVEDEDGVRTLLESSMSRCASPARLELIQAQVGQHVSSYTRTDPAAALAAVIPDLAAITDLTAQRHPVVVHRQLSRAVIMLMLLAADANMKLGRIAQARRWYQTAFLAARDADDQVLSALVLAQQTMLAYYYETAQATVTLARHARDLAGDHLCDAAALAAAAQARALGRLGDRRGVADALQQAERLTDRLADHRPVGDDSHAAYRFNHGRLLLYASGTWTNLGDVARAQAAQRQALRFYAEDPRLVVDPALIRLDTALTCVTASDPGAAVDLASNTLDDLAPAHRTGVVLARARDVLTAVEALPAPRRPARVTGIGRLRALTAAQHPLAHPGDDTTESTAHRPEPPQDHPGGGAVSRPR